MAEPEELIIRPKISSRIILLIILMILDIAITAVFFTYLEEKYLVLLAGGAIFVVLLLIGLSIIYKRVSLVYRIGAEDVDRIEGLIAPTETSLPIEKISEVKVERSIISRFLGIADIYLRGTGGASMRIVDVDSNKIRETLQFLWYCMKGKGKAGKT
ncbi:MAG: PH domain-containing protein [Candidatus Micrarchaeia archaeon]